MHALNKSMANRNYSDVDLSFNVHPSTGDILRKEGEEAVKRSIRHLVLTNFYEVPFKPDFGSGVRGLLFNLSGSVNDFMIKQRIEEVIKKYEPRAKLIGVSVISRPSEKIVAAKIIFNVINTPEPVTLNLALERIR